LSERCLVARTVSQQTRLSHEKRRLTSPSYMAKRVVRSVFELGGGVA
jgi:hypothetical protein